MAGEERVWVPDACTLPTAEQPSRVQEFDDLLGSSVRPAERIEPTRLRVHLPAGDDVVITAQSLIARETMQVGMKQQIVENRQFQVDRWLLEHDAKLPQGLHHIGPQIVSANPDRAGVRLLVADLAEERQ